MGAAHCDSQQYQIELHVMASHTQTGISSPTLASTCPYSRDRSSLANQRHPRPIREAALYLIILLACRQDAIGQDIHRRTIEPQTLLNT